MSANTENDVAQPAEQHSTSAESTGQSAAAVTSGAEAPAETRATSESTVETVSSAVSVSEAPTLPSGAAVAVSAAEAPREPAPADAAQAASVEAAAEAKDSADAGSDSMEALMEQYAVPQEPAAEGEIVDGHVVAIIDLGVVVDIGGKFEALIPAVEFTELKTGNILLPGQTVPVHLLHERKDGYALVSYLRAHRRRAWENIERAHRGHEVITGKITERIRGGLVVDIGVPAFLPASQVDLRPVKDFDAWTGQEITCRILKMNRKRGNVVVSRRVLLEEELKAQRDAVLDTLAEGAIVKGKVKNLTDYGVFVDLGGVDGLLHVTDISWGRVAHPSQALNVGDELEVQILKFDREKMRISLGRKQMLPDPWATVPQRYSAGMRVYGKVVGVTDYGAFVELEPGVEGLVHISEMTWSKRMKHPSKIVTVGDELEVVVLDLKEDQRRISLGLKQTLPDPWLTLPDKYPVGSTLTGRVRSLTDFGAFVEVEEGIDGLVHVSDISWTQRIKHPSEAFKKGDTIEAKVLKIDTENRRLSLGVKQVNDIWADWFGAHHVNDIVRGKVLRLTNFGAFVELAAGIEGLCHISEIEERRPKGDREKQQRSGQAASILELGKEYGFKILRLDTDQRKIALSYRGAQHHEEKRTLQEYRSSKSSPKATIGDIMLSKRDFS